MLTARPHSFTTRILFALAFCAFVAFFAPGLRMAIAQESREILPLSHVRPGMQGYAYTIFAGDQVEKFDLEVLGVLDNFLGPKQSIILVQLKGPKVESVPLPIWCMVAGIASGMIGGHWDISWHLSIFVQIKRAGEIETGVFDARVQ